MLIKEVCIVSPRLLVPCLPNVVTEYRTFNSYLCAVFPCLFFEKFFVVVPGFFLPRHGSCQPFRRPSPSESPLLRVCQGVLQARRGDGVG